MRGQMDVVEMQENRQETNVNSCRNYLGVSSVTILLKNLQLPWNNIVSRL